MCPLHASTHCKCKKPLQRMTAALCAVQAAAITMYSSELVRKLRKQVAVNASFICYALKTGHIRILSKKLAGQKALIKGLQAPVTDMQ